MSRDQRACTAADDQRARRSHPPEHQAISAPNGEVIALLVISPSKTDREGVIPMLAELFAVITAIIRRHNRAACHG